MFRIRMKSWVQSTCGTSLVLNILNPRFTRKFARCWDCSRRRDSCKVKVSKKHKMPEYLLIEFADSTMEYIIGKTRRAYLGEFGARFRKTNILIYDSRLSSYKIVPRSVPETFGTILIAQHP